MVGFTKRLIAQRGSCTHDKINTYIHIYILRLLFFLYRFVLPNELLLRHTHRILCCLEECSPCFLCSKISGFVSQMDSFKELQAIFFLNCLLFIGTCKILNSACDHIVISTSLVILHLCGESKVLYCFYENNIFMLVIFEKLILRCDHTVL